MSKDKCWYEAICAKYNADCKANCIRYNSMSKLVQESNLPQYLKYPIILNPTAQEVESYELLKDIKDNVEIFVEKGKCLYLYSKICGNGKTTWASKILLSYFNKTWAMNNFNKKGLFIHLPDLINKFKTQFLDNESMSEEINQIKNCNLLILDDLGVTELSNNDLNNLLNIVDYRINNNKSIIFTSNLDKEALLSKYGGRLTSRVFNHSIQVELGGFDRRTNK